MQDSVSSHFSELKKLSIVKSRTKFERIEAEQKLNGTGSDLKC